MKKEKYILGLDLGTGSVGWSMVKVDKDNNPCKIIDLGSRIFSAESGKVEDRRNARGTRRILRRRKRRIERIKALFIEEGLLTKKQIDEYRIDKLETINVLDIKIKGKKEKLSNEELFAALIHYAKHRGFKSNRKVLDEETKNDKGSDEGKLLQSINTTDTELNKLIENKKDATISDYIKAKSLIIDKAHNDSENYIYGVTRSMIEKEVDILLNKQINYKVISNDFKKKYKEILFKQRNFAEGPELPSQYNNPLRKMIGIDRYTGESRASRNSYSYLRFCLLQKLTDLRIKENNQGKYHKLTKEQIQIIDKGFSNGDKITYNYILKIIGKDSLIKNVDYEKEINKEKRTETIIKTKTKDFGNEYRALYKALKEYNIQDYRVYDLLSECFSRCKSDYEIESFLSDSSREILKDVKVDQSIIDFALNYKNSKNYKTFGSVSLSFANRTIPHMLEGDDFYSAKEKEGFADQKECQEDNNTSIPVINDILEKLDKTITNKSVSKTIVESRKIVNAIISKYGAPHEIHIEMARELPLSSAEKDKYEMKQFDNYKNKQDKILEIYSKYQPFFQDISSVTSQDILKYELWKEQDGICPYSLAKYGDEKKAIIHESDLFSERIQVEHIVPYSKSYDDRKSNKIIVKVDTNIEKGDNLPNIYYKNTSGYKKYINFVDKKYNVPDNKYLINKYNRLMAEDITEFLGDYHARTINDTRYAMTTFLDVMRYSFPKIKIKTYVGSITAKLRAYWRLNGLTTSYLSENYRIKENEEVLKKQIEQIEVIKKIEKKSKEQNILKNDEEWKEARKELDRNYNEQKKNRGNHYHHAVDATITACATDKMRRAIEKQEIINRSNRRRKEEFEIRVPKCDPITGEVVKDYDTGEVIFETIKFSNKEKATEEGQYVVMEDKKSKFPLPYKGFVDELLCRTFEMNEEKLKSKMSVLNETLDTYSTDEINNLKPVIISHEYKAKVSGRLHEATYRARKNIEGHDVLTVKMSIKSDKFDSKKLEKIFDKEKTQNFIYHSIKEWLGKYKNGNEAFEAHGKKYPINKNGKQIKKVSVIDYDEIREQFELKKGQGNYVDKDNNVQVWIYKNINDSKLYFAGLDRYRLLNYEKKEKNIDILLWDKQNHYIKLNNLNENNDFYLYRKIICGQTIQLKLKNNAECTCIAGGSFSGFFEVKTLTGDDYDLHYNNICDKTRTRKQITVSNIIDVKPISIDVLGKIH